MIHLNSFDYMHTSGEDWLRLTLKSVIFRTFRISMTLTLHTVVYQSPLSTYQILYISKNFLWTDRHWNRLY